MGSRLFTYCWVVKGSLTRNVSPFSWQAGHITVLVARRSSRIGVTLAMTLFFVVYP